MSILKFARHGITAKGSKQSATLPEAGIEGRSGSVRSCARLLRSEEGGPIIEFAFVLPMMMVCLTGIFTFGVAIYNALVLTQATGAGAQYLQQIRTTATDPCANTLSAIETAAPNLKPSSIGLSISIDGGTPVTASTCASQLTNLSAAQGEPVTVSTTYPCSLLVYGLKLGGCQLSAKVTEYEY
ncbi:MAG: TadE/TadG family type IV pilus assembly protein [Terracidiphilus sp.]